MLPSRGIGLAGPGLRCARPIPPQLQGTRKLSQCSNSRSLLFSKTPSRPIRPSPSSLATIGRANISLWPWSSKKEGLGFSPPATREGTPEPSSVSANTSEPATDTHHAATSASDPPQPSEPSIMAESMDPTPLPLESADDSILAAIQTPLITEDHYGFLREMGLEYGFGVTNMLETVMESIHVYAGTEWWATIALSAIAVRCVMAIPMAIGSHHAAKLELIRPYSEEAQEKLAKAKESNDPIAMQEAQKEVSQLMKAVGVRIGWPLAPMFLQGVFGYCAFKLMRQMTALPVPGLETGGILWFLDLTARDPYLIIPLTMGGLIHLIGRMGGEMGSSTKLSPFMRNGMLYYAPVVVAAVVAFQPAALQVSFLTAMIWGAGQGYLFRQAWFRKFFRMEPLPDRSTQSESSSKVPQIVTGNNHQARIAPPASGKPVRGLRTVSPMPLKYEAPRVRAKREMAGFHPPKELETEKQAAPVKNIAQTILRDATSASKAASEKANKWIAPVKKMMWESAPDSKQQRAEEYERRRKKERQYEAETRRQGKR